MSSSDIVIERSNSDDNSTVSSPQSDPEIQSHISLVNNDKSSVQEAQALTTTNPILTLPIQKAPNNQRFQKILTSLSSHSNLYDSPTQTLIVPSNSLNFDLYVSYII